MLVEEEEDLSQERTWTPVGDNKVKSADRGEDDRGSRPNVKVSVREVTPANFQIQQLTREFATLRLTSRVQGPGVGGNETRQLLDFKILKVAPFEGNEVQWPDWSMETYVAR